MSNFCPLTSMLDLNISDATNSSFTVSSDTESSSSVIVTVGAPTGRRKYQMQCSSTSRAMASTPFGAYC